MRLWIDDEREAPEGWQHVYTSAEALAVFASGAEVSVVSFDHDLGGDDTTRRVMLYLCEHGCWPAEVRIHTANSIGREWLMGMVQHYSPEGTCTQRW